MKKDVTSDFRKQEKSQAKSKVYYNHRSKQNVVVQSWGDSAEKPEKEKEFYQNKTINFRKVI